MSPALPEETSVRTEGEVKYGFERRNDLLAQPLSESSRNAMDRLCIELYVHRATGLRLVTYKALGPISNLQVLVPTEPWNNRGHAHCLEHLVFLGSAQYPKRGYLDTLASRCFADGTNAWTSTDHTAFTFNCAGSEGLVEVLPVFMDHILSPVLTDGQFNNEIFHIMGDGKHAGVVYSEMQARENSESDLSERAWRAALYPNTSFAYDSGGITKDIAQLTNQQVREFHDHHYRAQYLSVLVGGSDLDIDDILETLDKFLRRYAVSSPLELAIPGNRTSGGSNGSLHIAPWSSLPVPMPRQKKKVVQEKVMFPSADDEFGSVVVAWRGPMLSDTPTIIALTVLFRYLVETAASPMNQEFVEISSPLASSIDFDMRHFPETSLVLSLNGVPSSIVLDGKQRNLLEPGILSTMIMKFFKEMSNIKNSLHGGIDTVKTTIRRLRIAFLEGMESSVHHMVTESLIPDLVYSHLGHSGPIGSMLFLELSILDQLLEKDEAFWKGMIQKYLVDGVRVEIYMIPDPHLAKQQTEAEQKDLAARTKRLGENGLKELEKQAELVAKEIEVSRVNGSEPYPEMLSSSKVPRIFYNRQLYRQKIESSQGDLYLHAIQMDTAFVHGLLCFDTRNISEGLRVYLSLFTELMLTCDIVYPNGVKKLYQDFVNELAENTLFCVASMGISGGLFYPGSSKDSFTIQFLCEPDNLLKVTGLLRDIMFFGQASAERLESTCKNLYGEAIEELRDGTELTDAIGMFLCEMISGNGSKGHTLTNNMTMSVFRQALLLKSITAFFENQEMVDEDDENSEDGMDEEEEEEEDEGDMSDSERMKGGNKETGESEDDDQGQEEEEEDEDEKEMDLLHELLHSHPETSCQDALQHLHDLRSAILQKDSIFVHLASSNPENAIAAVSGILAESQANVQLVSDFQPATSQLHRQYISINNAHIGSDLKPAVVISVPGLESAYLQILGNCDVPKYHPDYFALEVLNEVMSRTEGVLYSEIRGKGLSYGASIYNRVWEGKLIVNISESPEPQLAYEAFCHLLDRMEPEVTASESTSPHGTILDVKALETARSCVTFNLHDAKRTNEAAFKSIIRSFALGMQTSMEEDVALETRLDQVDVVAMKRVFKEYLLPLRNGSDRLVIVVCNPGAVERIRSGFLKCKYPLDLHHMTLSDIVKTFI